MANTRARQALRPIAAGVALGLFALGAGAAPPEGKGLGQGMKVQIDKDSGELRSPTAEESRAMEESATQRELTQKWWDATVPTVGTDEVITLPNGTQAVRLDADSMEAFGARVVDGKVIGLHTDADGTDLDSHQDDAQEVPHDH